jgi:hypothetical protein
MREGTGTVTLYNSWGVIAYQGPGSFSYFRHDDRASVEIKIPKVIMRDGVFTAECVYDNQTMVTRVEMAHFWMDQGNTTFKNEKRENGKRIYAGYPVSFNPLTKRPIIDTITPAVKGVADRVTKRFMELIDKTKEKVNSFSK